MRATAIVITVLMYAAAARADELRCGHRLATAGETREAVRNKCGEPVDVSYQSMWQRPSLVFNGRWYVVSNEFVEVPVEIWTYNFGPNKFMRRVRFIGGLLEEVETLGYGYHEKR